MVLACAGTMTFGACTTDNRTAEGDTTDTTTTTTTTETTTETTGTGTADNDAMYREQARTSSQRMATDLRLDTAQQRRLETTYYNRTRRYGDLGTRYSSDTTGMYSERMTIDRETDAELKTYLKPDQYTTYESRRREFFPADFPAGSEVKVKTDDTKMKMEGDESKYKSGDTKMKTEAGESKYQSGDTKVKTEGNESKYKSGDTKVKSEEGEYKYKSGDTKVKVEKK